MIGKISLGAVAGLFGGLAFGMVMGVMGMLPMVAQLVGSSSAAVGFLVHLVNSAIIGGAFGFFFGERSRTATSGLGFGLAYGLLWWFLGPLTLMPVFLGMGVKWSIAGIGMALPSLWGHLLYGAITGWVFWRFRTIGEERATRTRLA